MKHIDYILRKIDPDFWHRVKVYALSQRLSIKGLILNLLIKEIEGGEK